MDELFDMTVTTERDLIEGLAKSGLCPAERLRPMNDRLTPDLACVYYADRGIIACLQCWEQTINNIRDVEIL